ncbi:MAG: von Willebrand factor type A domain-containing protein [Bacteroidota bacterium]
MIEKPTPRVTTKSRNGTIEGKIVDSQTGDPLAGASVLIVGAGRGAVTDTAGAFTIIDVPPGKYVARVSLVGYQAVEVTTQIDVEPKSTELLAVGLQAEDIEMEGVTVEATRPIVNIPNVASGMTVNREAAQPLPNANSVFGLQAGVTRSGGRLFLRGGIVQENSVVVDGLNTEQYDHLAENEFKESLSNPLSTFSIDVDNASYSNIRRFINGGQFPPTGAVRIEEMINYFTYDYPQPKGEHPFSVTMELAQCPWNSDNQLMLIGLQGKKVANEDLPPSNLVFLIDVSGSMQPENKLPLVKRSFRLLVDQLRPTDRVAIAVYAGSAGLVLPSTSGRDKQTILNAIDQLESGGSTAGGAGINLAYSVAKENFLEEGNNRVILATDGDFNVGVTNDDELVRLIEEKRKDGIFLSVLGFGMGNVKDSRMEKLADKGNGNYAYIDNLQEARKVFVGQMAGTLYTIAKDVKLQIEFNPANVKAYRLVGYENRILNKEDFNDDRKDAGDMGAGHSVTALYEIVPADGDIELPAVDSLKYSQFGLKNDASSSRELATVKLRYKHPSDSTSKLLSQTLQSRAVEFTSTSDNFRFALAVAEFGMLLRDSKFKGNVTYDHILEVARKAKGEDDEGYRSEFIRLVEMSKLLPTR